MVTLIDAARNGKLSQVCQILCAGRTDINCRDSEKKGTPLFWAANGGHDEIVTLLLDSGADIEIPVKWGMTPLLAAVDRKHLSTAKILLARGADVDAQSQNGDTALHLAAYRGSSSLCKLLIDFGASKHFLNNTGKTAQQGAEAAGHKAIIKLLAPETSHKAVCRSSSLPSAQRTHSPVEATWREPRVPSESDDSPFITEEEEEWNSLQRKLSKEPLQHPMAMAIRRDGDILRYYSAQQLDKVGRVSPPSTQPSTAHWRSPHLHHEDSVRPPRRGSNPEMHRDNRGQTPGHHVAGAHFSRDMKQDSNRRWSPPLPRQHSAGSSIRQYPAVPLHRDSHFEFLESSGNGSTYKTNGQSARQMLHSQHSVPGYFSRELNPSFKEPLPNVSNGRDLSHRLRPDSPSRTSEMGNNYHQRMDMSRNFKGEHMQHPGILANAGSAMANTGHSRTTDNHVQWSAEIPHRHKTTEQLTQGLVNPKDSGVPGVEHQRLSTDLSSAGVSYRQSTQRSANVQNAGRGAVDPSHVAQDAEVRQLHSVIEQLLEDKLNLTEQNQMMGERLNRLELALDAALAADSSSEGSWQTSSDSDLVQALARKLDSNLGRSSRLEQLCLKLLDDNQRLHALSAPSARLEGSRIDSQQIRGLIDDQFCRKDGHSTSRYPDLRPGTGCTGGRSPSERSTSSSSLSPTSTSSYDYGSGSDHAASLQKSSGDEECLSKERMSVKQQNSRMTFARECWHSLNSTYPRVAFQSGNIASTAMKVGGITLASQNRTENVKKVLQALNENDKQCDTRGQYSTNHGDIGQSDFSHTVDISEKLSYTARPDGSISAEFLCVINKKQCRLKVDNSKRFEQERDVVENVEEFLPPSPHLHLPIHCFEASPRGDGRLFRQILKQLQANLPQTQENLPGSQETGHHPSGRQDGDRGLQRNAGYHLDKDSFHCRVYPSAILNLEELFEWGMINVGEDAAPCTDTGIIRILLQLLLAVDHLHQKGVTHGNIHPGCVYVMENLRVVLGGLEKARFSDQRHGIAEVTTGQSLQESEDTFAIAETLCKLLSSQRGSSNSPAEATNKLVNTPPDWLPVNLRSLLREMLSSDPENRPPVKSALLRAAAMLYGPESEEVSSEADCEEWLISQALRLIITAPHDRSLSLTEEQDYSDCIYRLDWGLSRDFILWVTPQQLWKFCQQHVKT